MLPIKTILHPTDFSVHSENALRLACALARDYGARLVVLHVVEPPVYYGELGMTIPMPDQYEKNVKERLHQLEELDVNVPTETRLAEGFAAEQILRAAEATRCDLIVIGSHGRTGLGRLLMGSVAEEVMRHATCPVLTVRTPVAAVAASLAAIPVGEAVTA